MRLSIAGAINALLNNTEQARAMGLKGSNRVAQAFDLAHMIREYETLYARLVFSRHASRC